VPLFGLRLDKFATSCKTRISFFFLVRLCMTSRPDWRHDNTGRLLFDSTRRFQERVLQLVNGKGFPAIRIPHLAVTRHIDVTGTRIADVAARAGVTKQSMGEMIDQLDGMNYLTRAADADDKRAKIVKFTREGRKLLATIQAAVATTEKELAARIGTKAVKSLRDGLMAYCRTDQEPAGQGAGRAQSRRQRPL
jgi:DNA-binding MarR family transcriptional regulator